MNNPLILLAALVALPLSHAAADECRQSFTTPNGQVYSVPCGKGRMSPMYMQPQGAAPSSSYGSSQYGGGGGNRALGGALMGLGNAMMNMGANSSSDDDDE